MNTKTSKHFVLALLIAVTCGVACADSGVNLAAVAEPSTSYVSGDTSLAALGNENEPRNSRDRPGRAYGNWPRRGTQWVQYDWSRPISTNEVDVYWWDDNRGVRLPKACRLLYWDGGSFVAVSNASGLGVAGDKYNKTRLTPRAKKIFTWLYERARK